MSAPNAHNESADAAEPERQVAESVVAAVAEIDRAIEWAEADPTTRDAGFIEKLLTIRGILNSAQSDGEASRD